MNRPKVSVIVPIYNVEKYLKKCLHSLWEQTYKNIEFIIVDDCSTDSSKEIIFEEITNRDNVIFIENKNNRGLSYSRNIALTKATGDYIGYVDSDDYIDKNYYEELVKTAMNEKSDIVVCNINTVQNDKATTNICGGKTKKDFIDNGLAASACNKLFKKEIIKKYIFEEGKVNEDLGVVIPTMINCKKISYNPIVSYYYVQRNNSIQNSSFQEKRFDIFDGVELAFSRIESKKNIDQYKDIIVFHQIIMLLFYGITKESNFVKRSKLLKKYHYKAKKYNIYQNKRLQKLYQELGLIYKIYYKSLITFGRLHCFALESLIISIYHRYKKNKGKSIIEKNTKIDDLIKLAMKQSKLKQDIKVSVVVPNYNYEQYLYQRIYSILNQTRSVEELIILDDCSTDTSREKIDLLIKKLKPYINIKKIYNKENTNNPFKQWQKGLNEAKGDYVWIAEADDYCSNTFLEETTKPLLKNPDIVLAYCDTAFINGDGSIILKTVKKQIDIQNTNHWNHDYIIAGEEEFKNYTYLNCTIANVSSALIKKDNYDKEFEEAIKYRQAGDWVFYSNIMHRKNKKVAYINKTLNYYRVHNTNISSTTKKVDHINEIKKIHNFYRKKYGLSKKQENEINKRYQFLEKVWNLEK